MRANDAVIGVVLIIFALAEMLYTRTFPTLHGQAYGPDLFPKLIGAGICVCGVILIVRGMLARRASSVAAPWLQVDESLQLPRVRTNLVLLTLSLLSYILFSEVIGFVPMSLAILTLLFVRLGSSVILSLILAVTTTLILYLVFSRILLVPLPSGILQGILL